MTSTVERLNRSDGPLQKNHDTPLIVRREQGEKEVRRPWVVVLGSFALVMALGGLALAAIGVDETPNDIAAATSETGSLPSLDEERDGAEGGIDAFENDGDKRESDAKEVDEKPESDVVEKDKSESDEFEKDKAESDEKDESDHQGAHEPPDFEILWPHDGAVVDDEKIAFEGVTTPGSRVFAGPWEADVNDDGGWRIVLFLEPGVNRAVLHAESEGGVTEDSVTVTRVVADEPDEPKDEPTHELVAHQQYGFCEEAEPYDVFWGETAPGATVLIWSEYGSKEVVAGPEGGWEAVVHFPEAPYGVEFQVKVKSIEQTRYFEFTSYGNPPQGES